MASSIALIFCSISVFMRASPSIIALIRCIAVYSDNTVPPDADITIGYLLSVPRLFKLVIRIAIACQLKKQTGVKSRQPMLGPQMGIQLIQVSAENIAC